MEAVKFCRDCRWLRLNSECAVPDIPMETDLVTGWSKFPGCYAARAEGGPCGPDAKLFQAKEDAA